ncbi:MATE family efflux transporter [Alicyclobacillus sp. SO9]|uniref:MATE family efflux transporter n=1 Tax=Alicyclobacillus sp. SO9 TaxID=2665646 RepID=UPI0018E6FF5E|nr:MATE family efflux transporter [Alicyclobacillus sp. SO9]QQE78181.1 MATE family efflux transporter [Alicyclobacillus sp. SO9]
MSHVPQAARRIFAIAWPAIGEAYLQNFLGVVDMIFIAHISLAAVAAVGVTNIYKLTYTAVFTAVSTALSVSLSRYVGARQFKTGRAAIWHAFIIVLVVGTVLGVASVLFSVPLLRIMGARGALLQTAIPYFQIVLAMAPLIALFTAQSAAFRAIGMTKIPLRIGLEMNAIHVVVDYLLIFGFGPIPALGIRGAALSLLVVRIYALARLWWKSRCLEAIALSKADLTLQLDILKQMMRFSLPAAAERLSKRLGQVLYFGIIVRMGVDVYATHNIAGTLTPFASAVGEGFSIAATAAIGNAIGRGHKSLIDTYRRWSYLQAAVSMTVITGLLCIFSPWIAQFYTHSTHVINLLTVILAIDTISQPFMSSVVIDTATIQVGGNTRFPMMVTTIGIWCIRSVGVYVFGWRMGFGLPAVWASIAVDNMIRSVIFTWYRRKRAFVTHLV